MAESHFLIEVRGKDGKLKETRNWSHNLTTDSASGYTNRRDWQSKAMGLQDTLASYVGNATASSSTTLTNSGASFPTSGQALSGRIVAAGPNTSGTGSTVYGLIVSNTGTALTVDKWYNPATHATGTTPNSTASYQVLPGQLPAGFIGVSDSDTTPSASATSLSGELSSDGFTRALATFAHTAAASTYTMTVVFTATGTHTIYQCSLFGSGVTATGVMPFTNDVPNPPTLVSGDVLTIVITVTVN